QLVSELVSGDRRKEVEEYVERTRRITEIERTSTEKEKTGLFIGRNVINPVNSERVPIWISDYVLESYGTGAVFACPAHDQRDFEFANKFGLKIQEVVRPPQGPSPLDEMKAAYLDSGVMVNSGPYNGLSNRECSRKIVDDLSCHVGAEKTVQYKLRDWLISRQRYWGTPIPIIYCPRCGEVPVPEEELPVFLPEKVEFKVAGESPLTTNPDFVNTPCPRCGEPGRREVDTMDTFVCSSWYFLRFVDPDIDSFPFNRGLANKWLPVDQYVGGAEHAVMHLLYARFFTMALHDMGLIDFEEPFLKLNHQGMIRNNAYFCPRHGYLPKDRTERDGKNLCCTTCGYPLEIRDEKISKSKYNSVDPEQYIHQYGADTFRMYLMFMGSYEEGGVWSEKGITGIHRFVNRVWRLVNLLQKTPPEGWETGKSPELERLRHYTIREVTGDLEGFHFNTAISRLMELTNSLYLYIQDVPPEEQHREILKTTEEALITLLAPFAPHLSEELWHRIGGEHSIFDQTWPAYDEDKILLEKVTIAIQVNGKLRDQMEAPLDIEDELLKEMALSQQKIKKYVEGHRILKTIVVKNKLLNIVVQ
ncbi:leucine--tRNA ligase, partial [candidate division KSB1 bacterium]|nr:leucine--tRNA ligase [candidate division KSB1 bacterium]